MYMDRACWNFWFIAEDDTESCYFDGEVEIQVEEGRRFWVCPECDEVYWEVEGW